MEEEVASGINPIMIVVIIFGVAFAGIVIAYMALRKKMTNSDVKRINELRSGTSEKKFDTEIIYQKLYVRYLKTPFLKRYLLKVRRRIEINNLDDEFLTRFQSAQIITKGLLVIIPLTIAIVLITHNNILLMVK